MDKATFADLYAELGLQPTGEIVLTRTASAERIIGEINDGKIFDLVLQYFGFPNTEMAWFRDEFAKEDAAFSLVNNEREVRVLSAGILAALVARKSEIAILALLSGGVSGHRSPSIANRLVLNAQEAMMQLCVDGRSAAVIDTEISVKSNTALDDELTALAADPAAIVSTLKKVRTEAQLLVKTVITQTNKALASADRELSLLREESQMLWWIFSGHSRTLERSFSQFKSQHQVALIAAIDLGDLTDFSRLGPVAAPAMLERSIAVVEIEKQANSPTLASIIDSFPREDLQRVSTLSLANVPAKIAPILFAVKQAASLGPNAWQSRFEEDSGLKATVQFDPLQLANQVYRECLLSQIV